MSIQVILFLFIYLSTVGILNGGEVIKCLKQTKERIKLSCPRDHVIYNPIILGGASKDETCTRTASDCTGLTASLKRQTERCFWRKRCFIKLHKTDSIPSCSVNMTSPYVTYIIIKQAYCVPKNCIIDLCKASPAMYNMSPGIIRSHRSYPRARPKPIKCHVTIPLKSHDTLYMETVSLNGRFPFGLHIKPMTNSGIIREINTTQLVILHGNETKSIQITANIAGKRRFKQGFAIQFAAYKSKSLDAVLQWPKKSRPVLTELGRIRDVRPVIEQCAAHVQGHMTLSCDPDELIYSPAISLSGYNYMNPKCSFARRYKCGGFTADILVQRNSCYWEQTCDITWRQSDRIILSKEPACIGYYASTLGLSGHRCVQKRNIFDVCTTNTSRVNVSWAVLRSHATYPWYFSDVECKRTIVIGGRQAGVLIVQDMNLDPDGRDNFTVEHITKSSKSTVMNTKSCKEGTQVIVRGGKLIVHFKPFKTSKSGRGFILVFRRFHVSKKGFDDRTLDTRKQIFNPEILHDEAHIITHRLSNRRLCSLKGKRRRKGRACNRRVWTDYYIRLE